ncbi:MAG: ATP-binding cassette domain-containing protein [Myxococcota bacterium]
MHDYPVEVEALVARYGPRTILKGVDMRVRPGEVRVVLGGSGSGKSTLLKHVIGLLKPAGGVVRLLGTDLGAADEPERNAVLTRIGMLFQGGALLNSLTVADNVALPLRSNSDLPASIVREVVRMKLELVDLSHAIDLFPPELSGGMKKRAALARAMAFDPDVLFCDEPSAGLDPITAADLDRLLLGLRDRFGMALVVVTHELASVETIADRVTMLDHGRVLVDGTLDEARRLDHPWVRAFFERVGTQSDAERRSVLDAVTAGGAP